MRILSLGAGVQSTTVFLMAHEGLIPPIDHAIFADTQEEPQEVYRHLAWLQSRRTPVIHVGTAGKLGDQLLVGSNAAGQQKKHKLGLDGSPRFVSIPAYTALHHESRPPGPVKEGMVHRQCTRDYKVEVVEWIIRRTILGLVPRQRVPKGTNVQHLFGISLEEKDRRCNISRRFEGVRWAEASFPLIDLKMTRWDCLSAAKARVESEKERKMTKNTFDHHVPIPDQLARIQVVRQELAAPFTTRELKWKPGPVSGNRALAMPYVDARSVMDRLDAVLGVAGWQDEYDFLPEGAVLCRLRIRLEEEWITRMDVGGASAQPDPGDRLKAALSDALKRTAVKFGVGRYLYHLTPVWCDYDPQKKRFTREPVLPSPVKPPPVPVDTPTPRPQRLPQTGLELYDRLQAYETKLVEAGLCKAGDLLLSIDGAVGVAYGNDWTQWPSQAIRAAVEEVKVFETKVRSQKATA